MSLQEPAETSSLFSVSGVRERMKEKKNGVLKTAKLNASLASKIRTKTINNSSIIKVSLKQNNKALAMALNAAKMAAQRHADDNMLLQKEVEKCHFENACLRQKLSSVGKNVDEIRQQLDSRLQNVIKMSRHSENGSCSLLLNDGGQSWTGDFPGDQDGDSRPFRAAPKPLRVLLSHVDDEESENGLSLGMAISTSLPMPPIGIPASGLVESSKSVLPTAGEKSSSGLVDESLESNEKNCQKLSEVDGATLALSLSTILGDHLLSVPPSPRSCSRSALGKNSSLQQCEEIVRPCSDCMVSSCGHVTKRKKHRKDLSAEFGGNSPMGPLDNMPLDSLRWAKETEPAATQSLDISQVGELVRLSTKKKGYEKIKATETKDRDSSISQSKRNVDHYSNGQVDTAILSETNRLSNSKINIPKPSRPVEDPSQEDYLEKIVPLDSHHWKEKHSSQHSDKATGCPTSSWLDPAPPNHVCGCNALTQEVKKRKFLEKKKYLERLSQSPETISLSNKVQQGEKSHGCDVKRTSQCSNKAKGCRRTGVVDPGPPDDENDYSPQSKKKTHLENFEDLESWLQSQRSSLLSNKDPLNAIGTQQLVGFQMQIPSQEAPLGRKKRKTPKWMPQQTDVPPRFGEIEVQSVDINMHSQMQESKSDTQESKTKKGYKEKTAKAGRDNTQREHCKTYVDVFDLSENAQSVNKRKNETSKLSLKSIFLASPGSTLSTFATLLDDEATPVGSVHRNFTKMNPKVQGSSTTQTNSTSSKTNHSSSQKAYCSVDNNVIGLKKRVKEEAMAKVKKRLHNVKDAYTVNYASEECVPSDVALRSPEECKTSQADHAGRNFLQGPSSKTLRDSLMDVTEVPPPLFEPLVICPYAPDSSSVGHSKIMLSSCRSAGHSGSVLPAAEDHGSPERSSALPKILTASKKINAKLLASTRREKKTVQATPETLPKENENIVLSDLTNASSGSCHSIPLEEVSATRTCRRRKNEVSYTEPKINRKLRRGDPFTVTDFLSSPIFKTKSKKLAKGSGKSRKTMKKKEKEVQPRLDFMTIS